MITDFGGTSNAKFGGLQIATGTMNDETTKERLLCAAIEEFATKGFDGATVRDICGRAEVNLNAVKYYYEDKRGLYLAAMREAHHRMVVRQPQPKLPNTGSAEQDLQLYIESTVSLFLDGKSGRQDESHHLLLSRELSNPSEATAQFVREFIEPRFQFLDRTLASLLPPTVSPIDRHLLVFSVVGECAHYRVARGVVELLVSESEFRKYTVPRITKHITDVILAAVDQHTKRHRKGAASVQNQRRAN